MQTLFLIKQTNSIHKEVGICKTRMNNNVDMSPIVCDYVASKSLIAAYLIFSDVQQHLQLLSAYFTKHVLKETTENFD